MIVTIDGIPVYNALIDGEDCGMFRISLVDSPAVMSDFLAFDKAKAMQMYAIANEEERRVIGCVMRADFPIYRRDSYRGEYYIIYKADTIKEMAEKYLLESRQNDVNLDHKEDKVVDGVQMVQYFIKDSAKGIVPVGFDECADGSLFAEFHIVNDEVWEEVKNGTYKGFSLEGVFALEPNEEVEDVKSIVDILEGKFSRLFKHFNKTEMSKVKNFFKALEAALVSVQFGSTTTDKGVIIWDGDDDLKIGDDVFVEVADGERMPAEDGTYTTEDGKKILIASGKVAEIIDNEAEVAPEAEEVNMGEVATDGGKLYWEGEDDLKAEIPVFVDGEDGELVPAPDGDYKTEDGKVIKVAEGKVAEIVDSEAEVEAKAEEETPAEEDKSLEARINALETMVAKIAEWMGIVMVDENGNQVMSKTLPTQMSAIKAEIETIKRTPAASSAHEEFQRMSKGEKTGNKGVDNLSRILSAK